MSERKWAQDIPAGYPVDSFLAAKLDALEARLALVTMALEATAASRDHYMALNGIVGLLRLYSEQGFTTAKKLAGVVDIEEWCAQANKLDLATSVANIKLREALTSTKAG